MFMMSWLSNKQRNRNIRQRYGFVAFPEDAKEKCQLGLRCRGFPRGRERVMFFRIMMLWLCQKPRIRKVSEVSDVVVFQKLQMQNLSHGYGVFAFQKVCERENVSQAYVIFAFAEAGKRYASQGYGEVVFLEAAKDKCQFGLCCCGFHSSRKREMLFYG